MNLNKDNCIFCGATLIGCADVIQKPTLRGYASIFSAARLRKDNISLNILSQQAEINKKPSDFRFHSGCRKSFCSKINIEPEQNIAENTPSTSSGNVRCGENFNIKTDCLICGKSGTVKKKSLISISAGTGSSTREKILKTSIIRNDSNIQGRMEFYTDLFAADAKYHKSCYTKYISERNVTSFTKKVNVLSKCDDFKEQAFQIFFTKIENDILKEKKCIMLKDLCNQLKDILENLSTDSDITNNTSNIRKKIEKKFGESLSFLIRPGKPTLVLSKEYEYDIIYESITKEHSGSEEELICDESENLALHRAAGILRKAILSHKGYNSIGHYLTPQDLNKSNFIAEIPEPLYKIISWILDEQYFADCSTSIFNTNVISTCSAVLNNFDKKKANTSYNLGLSVYIYQTVRSKKLIDILYNFGYGASYDEIRKFLTSLASEQIENMENGIFIPQGLVPINNDENNFFHASIDNFDLNEETLDGKSTTHSLAMVLFQKKSNIFASSTIQRHKSRSLNDIENSELKQQICNYKKPPARPEPPKFDEDIIMQCLDIEKELSISTDTIWRILRYKTKSDSFIGWHKFNELISENKLAVSNTFYYPFINAPPSSYDTIYTSLLKLTQIADKLGQNHVIVTADLAIYSKAQEILWSKPPALTNKVTMQLGGMHLTMAFIASIGNIFGDGGLVNMLVESGLYAEASCRQMLQGKHLYRAIRGITLVFDTLSRLFFKSMESWVHEKQGISLFSDTMQENIDHLESLCTSLHPLEEYTSTLEMIFTNANEFKESMSQFIDHGCKSSPTFKYWFLFLEAADILLSLLRSERNGDFELHLSAVKETLPFLKAGGRNNYAKFTPIYLLDMSNLKCQFPEMYNYLKKGNFVVKRSNLNKFNAVASDMALEQTVNRDCKSSGGVIGFTKSEKTLSRWLITRHLMGEYSNKLEDIMEKSSRTKNKPHGLSEEIRDQQDIRKMLTLIESTWINPFDPINFSNDLIHISTGKIASETVRLSLLSFKEKASSSNNRFVQERLTSCSNISFWKPVPRDPTKSFSFDSIGYKKGDKQKYINPDFMFRRIISAVQYKDLNFADILSFELTPVPVSIFHEDGTMRKNAKSELANKIEGFTENMYELPADIEAYFIDGMVLLQELNEKSFKTFDNLGDLVLSRILNIFKNNPACSKISIIFDRYDNENSIKASERQRRGENKIGTYSITGSRNVPNYRIFLRSSTNKASLIRFLTENLTNSSKTLPNGKELIIAGGLQDGKSAIRVTNTTIIKDQLLECNHEEADTRIIFHMTNEIATNKIVVKSDDTDVLILLLYYYWNDRQLNSCEIFMEKGHSTTSTNKKRFIPVHLLAKDLGESICGGLPAFHALTGCDTTNAFFKIGKKSAWQIFYQKNIDLQDFGNDILENSINIGRKLIVHLYRKEKCKNLDEIRLILTKDTKKSAKELPPTEDSFKLHAQRCHYQVVLWKSSHIGIREEMDPQDYGWMKDNDNIFIPKFSTKPPIPDEIRKLISLFCTEKNCNTTKCVCKTEGMFCSLECKCSMRCTNSPNLEEEEEEEDILMPLE